MKVVTLLDILSALAYTTDMLEKIKKNLLTWANFWTVVSLALGLVAYKVSDGWVGDASWITGAIAFGIGLV